MWNNFRLISYNLDLTGIREELAHSTLWVDMDMRPNRPKTQAGTVRIQLRTNQNIEGKHYHDIHETRDLPAWKILSRTREFVVAFAGKWGGEIGHVRVANLAARSEIISHIDVGEYCAVRDRFHAIINSTNGTHFTVGDEALIMRENELWWFDNKKRHSVKNLGDAPRTHLIFDIRRAI